MRTITPSRVLMVRTVVSFFIKAIMVRTYKRRTTKAAWSKATIEAALEEVRSGIKIQKAAGNISKNVTLSSQL